MLYTAPLGVRKPIGDKIEPAPLAVERLAKVVGAR